MYTYANSLHFNIKYAHDNTFSLCNYSFPLHLYQNSSLWYGKSKQSKTNAMTQSVFISTQHVIVNARFNTVRVLLFPIALRKYLCFSTLGLLANVHYLWSIYFHISFTVLFNITQWSTALSCTCPTEVFLFKCVFLIKYNVFCKAGFQQ